MKKKGPVTKMGRCMKERPLPEEDILHELLHVLVWMEHGSGVGRKDKDILDDENYNNDQ